MAVTTGTNYCTLEMVTRAKTDLIIILFEINIWITQKKRQLFDEALAKGLVEEVTFTGIKMGATDATIGYWVGATTHIFLSHYNGLKPSS